MQRPPPALVLDEDEGSSLNGNANNAQSSPSGKSPLTRDQILITHSMPLTRYSPTSEKRLSREALALHDGGSPSSPKKKNVAESSNDALAGSSTSQSALNGELANTSNTAPPDAERSPRSPTNLSASAGSRGVTPLAEIAKAMASLDDDPDGPSKLAKLLEESAPPPNASPAASWPISDFTSREQAMDGFGEKRAGSGLVSRTSSGFGPTREQRGSFRGSESSSKEIVDPRHSPKGSSSKPFSPSGSRGGSRGSVVRINTRNRFCGFFAELVESGEVCVTLGRGLCPTEQATRCSHELQVFGHSKKTNSR